MIIVNGENHWASEGKNMTQWLSDEGYNPSQVAIEYNGKILMKNEYRRRILSDGDVLEIVSFVGGG